MARPGNSDGFQAEVGDADAARWAAGLAKVSLAVMVIGVIATIAFWSVVSAELGAGILAGVFALTVGVFVIRQAILAERG